MSNYVLFSPLGMTDPTRGFHDGAFIHICRVYKPKKVYLYMSKEIYQYDQRDNRYERYLGQLAEELGFSCSVVKLVHKDLERAHDFERFYQEFMQYIRDIGDENSDSKILLNLSSGTPQMKTALLIVSYVSNRSLIPIQVSSPKGKSNDERPVDEEYDLEAEWELNMDNSPDYTNRCIEVRNENLNAVIKKEVIARHIAAYDYRAALSVAETITDFMSKKAIDLIKAGCYRLSLEVNKAQMYARSAGFQLTPKGLNEESRIAYEYILNMQIKLYKGELADFIRSISPILTFLFEMYIEHKCKIEIKQYYEPSIRYDRDILSRRLLSGELRRVLDRAFGEYKDKSPSAAILLPIIKHKGESTQIEVASILRDIEDKARNIVAHEVISINDDWIKEKTRYSADDILKYLKSFLKYICPIPVDAWDSYDLLNERILNILK